MPPGYTIDNTNIYTGPSDEGFFDVVFEGFVTPPPLEGSVKIYDGEGWIEVGHLPDQTGNSGKFLSTDGSDPVWAAASTGVQWTLVDNNPLTSLTGLTVRSGSWDLTGPGGTLKQTGTGATAYARIDIDITGSGYNGDLAAVEFETLFHGNGGSTLKRAWAHCTWDGSSNGSPVGGPAWNTGDVWKGVLERDAQQAGTEAVTATKAYNQWIQVRHLNWNGTSYLYIDGVLATSWAHAYSPGIAGGRTHLGLMTYGADASFRNLRGWTASTTAAVTEPW